VDPSDLVDGKVSIVEMESGPVCTSQFEERVAVSESVVARESVADSMEPAV